MIQIVLVSFLTFASRILGMFREIIYARFFGASAAFDSFLIAFSIPNMFRHLFGEGALSSAFIPTYVERLEKQGKKGARELLSSVWTGLILILTLLTALGIIATYIIPIFFSHPKLIMTLDILRITLPYLILICLTATLSAALNGMNHFTMPALSPVLLNIVIILAVLISSGTVDNKILLLGIAVLVGGFIQLAVQFPPLISKSSVPQMKANFADQDFRRIMKLFFPIAIVTSIAQVNEMLDFLIAEIFIPGSGAVSVLNYSNRLIQLPLAIIGISITTVAFTKFSARALLSDKNDFRKEVTSAVRTSIFFCIPAAAGIAMFAGPIVEVIFKRGAFDADAAQRTSLCVIMYAPSIVFYSVVAILTRAFYALKDARTPLKVNLSIVGLNFILNIVLVLIIRESGIALATTSSAFLSMSILGLILSKRYSWDLRPLVSTLIRTLLLSAAMIALCLWVYNISGSQLLKLSASISIGVAFFFITALLLKFPELRELKKS